MSSFSASAVLIFQSAAPVSCVIPTGHSDVSHHGRGFVLWVLQQVTCALPGGQATSHSDLLHQAAPVRLSAGCTRHCLPDPSGSVQNVSSCRSWLHRPSDAILLLMCFFIAVEYKGPWHTHFSFFIPSCGISCVKKNNSYIIGNTNLWVNSFPACMLMYCADPSWRWNRTRSCCLCTGGASVPWYLGLHDGSGGDRGSGEDMPGHR